MDLMETIMGRRSVRSFAPDPVPEEKLQKVLQAVQWAPSWANTQCWEVIVVKEQGTKTELVETLSSNNPAREAILQAPLTLIVIAIEGKAGFKKGEARTDKGDWYMFDCGLAMQNLCLAAHAEGLGTVIVGSFDAAKAAVVLQVPQGKVVVALTPLGFPEKVPAPPKRKEIEEFVYYKQYGRR
ncbi:MAG: nitroreductase family protein [Deltaproteobacteria bacterium]|nr:nitroreductase family protein [Deltaproteobacteria bacterium]